MMGVIRRDVAVAPAARDVFTGSAESDSDGLAIAVVFEELVGLEWHLHAEESCVVHGVWC